LPSWLMGVVAFFFGRRRRSATTIRNVRTWK
jgi:hypothetical protein